MEGSRENGSELSGSMKSWEILEQLHNWCVLMKGSASWSQTSTNKTNFMDFSPRVNYADWATATCRQNLVPTFMDRGVSRGQHGGSPTVINLSLTRPEPLLFFQVAPHLLSQTLQ
jgi:hypothetical protein